MELSESESEKLDLVIEEMKIDSKLKAEIITKVFKFINNENFDKRTWNKNAGKLMTHLQKTLIECRKEYDELLSKVGKKNER